MRSNISLRISKLMSITISDPEVIVNQSSAWFSSDKWISAMDVFKFSYRNESPVSLWMVILAGNKSRKRSNLNQE